MSQGSKKYAAVILISLIPLSVIVIDNFILYRKVWHFESQIQYEVIFWLLRLVLSPLVVWYTLKSWTKLSRLARLTLLQLTGLFLFLAMHWILSYSLLRFLIVTPKNRTWDLFETIVRNSFILNLLVYLVIVFILYVWEYFLKNEESDKQADNLKRSLARSQLEVLRNQLNTHFVFNTLHNISSQIMQEQKYEANDMLIKLSDLLRFSLKESDEQFVPVYKEIELTRLYLELQKKRFKERLNYTIDCPESLGDFFIPPFILQPLVENAIRYAIEPFSDPGTICVQIENRNEKIILKVADTGKMPFEEINFKGGVGLKNTRERLEQLYGVEFELETYPSSAIGKGVTFVIYLPLKYAGNATA
jgi:two-component system LytT family sensor kinase